MKVVRLSALRTGGLYSSGNTPGTCFCQRLSRPQRHSAAGRIMSMKNPNDPIWNRTRNTSRIKSYKGKSKVFPLQARLWPRGWVEVQLYFSMTTVLEGGEWSAARPGRTLPTGKTRYPLYRRLGGTQGRSGRTENLAPAGFDPRIVQPVVSRCTG